MFVKPASNDERDDATQDATDLGQPYQLIIRRCWNRRHPGAIEAIVASPRQLVKIGARVHPRTVPRLAVGFQS